MYSGGKSSDLVVAGTRNKSMRVRHSSHYRSHSDPATLGDIPPEVVRKVFIHLRPVDLAACRLVCRGLNPTAQDVLMSRLRVGRDQNEMVVCGLYLRRLVRFKSFYIKSLELNIKLDKFSCATRIAICASRTLSSLKLDFTYFTSVLSFVPLAVILDNCRGIRHLQLVGFNAGQDLPSNILRSRRDVRDTDILRDVRDGLSRLTRLDLIRCRGNVLSFIKEIDIYNLRSFSYVSFDINAQANEDIIMAIAKQYPTLAKIRLEAKFNSSASLNKVMKACPNLEKLIFRNKGGNLLLSRSDFTSLRRLKSLDIECEVEDDAVSVLASLKSLTHLRVVDLDPARFFQ
jgi:hypothetical protein